MAKLFNLKRHKQPQSLLPAYVWLSGILLFLLEIIYRNSNPSTDAWAYAADVRYNTELFRPHHLLYGPLAAAMHWLLRTSVEWTGFFPSAFFSLHVLSSLFGLACFILVYFICLHRTAGNTSKSFYLAMGASVCWGILRYSSTIEVYHPALAAALAGTLVFVRGNKYALLFSSLLLIVACLLHQSYIFWWLAMAAAWYGKYNGNGPLRHSFLFLLPGIIAFPLVYGLVLVGYQGTSFSINALWNFVLQDVVQGNISYPVGWRLAFFSIASVVRSYVQIHTILIALFVRNFWISLAISLVTALFIIFIVRALFRYRHNWGHGMLKEGIDRMALVIAGILFIFGGGNAEFLVPLPMLTAIWLAGRAGLYVGIARNVVIVLSLWNLWFGLYAMHKIRIQANEEIVGELIRRGEPAVFITTEKPTMENIYRYNTGLDACGPLRFRYSPQIEAERSGNSGSFEDSMKRWKEIGLPVYSDVEGRPFTLDKAEIAEGITPATRTNLPVAFSIETEIGLHTVYLLSPSK